MGEIAKHGSRNVILMYVGALIGFANTILLYPKILPKEEYGLISLVLSMAILLAAISSFGTPNALIRYFPHFRNNDNNANGGLVRFLLVISGGATLLILLLLVFFKGYVFQAYEKNAPLLVDYYYYILPIFFVQVFINLLTSYLNAIKRSYIQVFQKEVLIRIGQTVLIVLYHFEYINLELFMVLFVCLFLLSLVFLVGYLIFAGELHGFNERLDQKAKKEVWQFSIYTFLSGIARQISFKIDSLMVGALVVSAVMVGALSFSDTLNNRGLEAVSIYAVALNMSSMLEMPFRALNQSLAPSIAQAWAVKNMEKVFELYRKSTETMVVIGVYIAVGIWACVDQVLEILPDNYAEVKYVLGWLLLGKLLNVVAGSNGVVMMNSPKYKVLTYLSFVGLVLTVVSNYVFMHFFQIEGAAMATFVTYFIINTVVWFLIAKFYGLQPFTLRNLLTILLGVVIVMLAGSIVISNAWITIVLKAGLITVVFWGIVYITNLSPEVKKLIDDKVINRFKR
ncbi:oligosaccharide flippase family protein [Parvicella tangerina]|uniref:Polysaccharide biosynthesis protein n=1 Tax=Parvicella tangerina TaxID=2829795 RepID=A0A916JQU6_9FLAO|nr:oligosaccharide flippase family protein [Parvicella tangerina]CAG5085292.1 hypothetical protein CRYO30217_02714 [Parvicella tangerina]